MLSLYFIRAVPFSDSINPKRLAMTEIEVARSLRISI
jgi:hypothetical protein